MEDFYFEDSTTKEIIKKIFIGLLVVACFILLALYFYNKNNFKIKSTITLEAGSTLPTKVSKYVKTTVVNSDDYKIEIDGYELGDEVTEVGEIKYKVTYNKVTKEGTIVVKDTKAPEVTVEDLTIGLNEDYDLKLFITSCDDYSKPCIVTAKNDEDEKLNSKIGTHTVNLVITDGVGNKVEKKSKLIVKENYSLEKEKVSDINISYTDPEYDDFDESKIIVSLDEAVDPSTITDFGYEFLYEYLENNMDNYLPEAYNDEKIINQELITAYNRYGYAVAFAIRAELSNGAKVYFVK